ncbi:MAG TPA: alcohol dehydrogenase [Syntrophus sp. (in: bacteria)]|nr:alcohol dehydrogenase [Syntrophus sp. (in: bacteria)]
MKDWKKTIIHASRPILEALKILEDIALQIALVTDDDGRLIGVVTDGDIRRAMLQGVALTEAIQGIMFRDFTVVNPSTSREEILSLMKARDLRQIPVIDDSGKVVDLKIMLDLIRHPEKENWVVLMAGGLGTRLQPLTDDCPKPLLKVGNKPILETAVENFVQFGFRNFFVSVNYKAHMIEALLGDGSRWGVKISYLRESEKMGTAGSLSLLEEKPSAPLIVMNADVLTRVNINYLLDFHQSQRSAATMCIRKYHFQVPYGVVKTDENKFLSVDEKPEFNFFVNAGIYILDPQILDFIPQNKYFDMTGLFEKVVHNRLNTAVFPIHEYWVDIGRYEDFERANDDYENNFSK